MRADAQRSGWLRTDAYISTASMAKPGFKLLWQVHLGKAGDNNPLSEPVTFSRFSGEHGWKTLASLGSQLNQYFAVDNDLGTVYLDRSVSDAAVKGGTGSCPGGMTSGISRPVSLSVPELQGRGRGTATIRSGVGAADQGTPPEFISAGRGGAAGFPGVAGASGGRGAGGAAGGRGGFGNTAGAYVLTSDGVLHTIGRASGLDTAKPIQFISPESFSSGLAVINDVAYVVTMNRCGGVPDGVAAMDIGAGDKTTRFWHTDGGSPLGPPAFSESGTLFVSVGPEGHDSSRATCAGVPCSRREGFSNALVALDPKTLTPKGWFSSPLELSSGPVVIREADQEYVAVGARNGSVYLLDAASPGGADHKTAVDTSTAMGGRGSLAALRDSEGGAWILSSISGKLPNAAGFPVSNGSVASGAVVGWRLKAGRLEPAWVSADVRRPSAPIVVNGVVFVLAMGSIASHAELLALDGATGKKLWSSGQAINSWVDSAGLSASQGQVYVVTHNHTFYAFGFPVPVNRF